MTLILCYRFGSGIMLLGDTGFQVGGNGPPQMRRGARKVYRNANRQIALAGWGDLALPFQGTYCQPERWLEEFVRTRLQTETSADQAVASLERELRLPNYPRGSNGGLFVAGFLLYRPVLYEVTISPAASGPPNLELQIQCIPSDDLSAAPLIRGSGYQLWDRFTQDFGTPTPQNHREFVRVFANAVRTLQARGAVLSLPIQGVFIEPRYPEVELELEGSIAPQVR